MQAGPDEKAEEFRRLRPGRPIVRLDNNGSLEGLRDAGNQPLALDLLSG